MKFVEGAGVFAGTKVHSKEEAKAFFRRAADVASRPFIYLSAGVSNAEFTEALELAAEAGTRFSGVLCGRATWKDGMYDYRQSRPVPIPDEIRQLLTGSAATGR